MRIVVTGANGFVGRALVGRLLATGALVPGGPAFSRLTVADLSLDGLPEDPRLHRVEGSIATPGVLEAALDGAPDHLFHLASIPGGAAERDYDLGLAVNLNATLRLLELTRAGGRRPRLVFASTIAVYGAPLPARVDDHTPLRPGLSYGAHKLIGEILVEDYSRKGWIDGVSLRLPGIVARPPAPSGLLSAFMSDLFWRLAAGEPFVCPVSEQAVAWWMSVGCCVDNLLAAAALPADRLAARRIFALPVLRLTIGDLVEGLARRFGADRRGLVAYQPDPGLEAAFGAYPPLDCAAAEAVGFHHDGSIEALIDAAIAPGCQKDSSP